VPSPRLATSANLPSGEIASPAGDLPSVKVAIIAGGFAFRSIAGTEVKVTDTVTVGTGADPVSAVAIAPDGRRALAVKSAANKIAVLTIDNGKVTYDKEADLPANNCPYNLAIAPGGQIALVADTGNNGSSNGNVDTVTVIDLAAKPIHVIDHVTVGDSPEGLGSAPRATSR